jgi:hypothetical protein
VDLEVARTVARETVNETFLALGVDLRKPGEAVEVQHDFAFNRSARLLARKAKNAVVVAIVTVVTGGIVTALWQYVLAARAAGH